MQTKPPIQATQIFFLSKILNIRNISIQYILMSAHTHTQPPIFYIKFINKFSKPFANHWPPTSSAVSLCLCLWSLWHNFWFYLYAFDFDLFTLPTVHAHLHLQFAKCGTCDRINRNMLSIFIFDLGFPLYLSLFSLCMLIFLNLFHLLPDPNDVYSVSETEWHRRKDEREEETWAATIFFSVSFLSRFVTGCQPRENYVCCW